MAASAHAALTGHWKLDGNDDDAVGTHHGTFSGTEAYVAGRVGQALSLDGSSETFLGAGVISTSAYTKAAWVRRTTDGGAKNILSGDTADSQHALYLPPIAGDHRLASGHNAAYQAVTDETPVPLDTWTHVAVTYDAAVGGGTLVLYRDGRRVAGTAGVATNVAPPQGGAAYIGAFDGSARFTGQIDDVGVWDEVLSDEQVYQVFLAGAYHVDLGESTGFVYRVFDHVAEASDYAVLYDLEIPDQSSLGSTGVAAYRVNNADLFIGPSSFDRVAYYLELQVTTNDPLQWVYVSVDRMSPDVAQLGVPSVATGAQFQENLSNMNVYAAPGTAVTTGTNIQTGNIEFWGWNYGRANAASVPNASEVLFDAGDFITNVATYGSMQIHNHAVGSETLFAYNRWGKGEYSDLGIGNDPDTGRVNWNPDWTFAQNAGTYALKNLVVLVRPAFIPDTYFSDFPQDMQLYPRDRITNQGTVPIAGAVRDPGCDEVIVQVYRDGVRQIPDLTQALVYADGEAAFALAAQIPAELASYDFDVLVRKGSETGLVARVEDVVAGDVLLINGQSNAVASKRVGSANSNQSTFVRSYSQLAEDPATVIADLNWHGAEGDLAGGPGAVGQWGLRLGRLLVDTYGIPICIINGARGARPISYFQRNDSDPEDLATNYGRLLYRCRQAGVQHAVRAILWYQGETDQGDAVTHETQFVGLYRNWLQDYPGVEKVYVNQLRVGCGVVKTDVRLRDRQRRLADVYAGIEVMSTTGLNGHDGCHFLYEGGYRVLGERLFELVERDLYGAPPQADIEPPNPRYAHFSRPAHDEITVWMRNESDTLTFDDGAETDFQLESSGVTVTNGYVSGATLVLELSGPGDAASGVSYTGHSGSGPWVTNANGVGLLAFYNEPIRDGLDTPSAPTNLTAAPVSPTQLDLGWAAEPGASHYLVRRDGQVVATNFGTAYIDTDVLLGVPYLYEVAAANPLATSAWSVAVSASTASDNVYVNVPEAEWFSILYRLEMPNNLSVGTAGAIPYAVDHTAILTQHFDRVAYYVELQNRPGDPLRWVYVSVDPFTQDPALLGVPARSTGAVFQQILSNMTVRAGPGTGVSEGTKLTTGNIEFWGWSYQRANAASVPNASGSLYDAGDQISTSGTYGSMQIHNHAVGGETLFAYNRWGIGVPEDIGIGNSSGPNPDWTFETNAFSYVTKRLYVLVRLDEDRDGLPDLWELDRLGTLDAGPDDDTDLDGVSDGGEYIAATHPDDANSYPQIEVRLLEGGEVALEFEAAAERVYGVRSNTNLADNSWSTWTNNLGGNGETVTLIRTNATGPVEHYRFDVSLP